jgi:hypothetical protein
MKRIVAASVILLSFLVLSSASIKAEVVSQASPNAEGLGVDNPILNRARNLARQAAEKANGGLNNYRAEPSMYGPALDSPFIDNGGSWTFNFKGGKPDAELTIESIVTVEKDGSNVTVDYNGPIRNSSAMCLPPSLNPPGSP